MWSEMLTETPISNTEIEERVAVLENLRGYLEKQRNKFHEYLNLLGKEESDILTGDADKLLAHSEMEKEIIREIYAFQKVIDPLEDMYRAAYPLGEKYIPKLRYSLMSLREKVCERNEKNRALLRDKMKEIREEIRTLRRPGGYRNQFNPPVPNLLDIVT